MKYSEMVRAFLPQCLSPILEGMGFTAMSRLSWRRDHVLEMRGIIDPKATDTFRGGAFTLEIEVSDTGRFGQKVTGTARLEQLLMRDEQRPFVVARNMITQRLTYPPPDHLRLIPEFVLDEYLRPFRLAQELDPVFWMRFRSIEDLDVWCPPLRAALGKMADRATTLEPGDFVRQRHWG